MAAGIEFNRSTWSTADMAALPHDEADYTRSEHPRCGRPRMVDKMVFVHTASPNYPLAGVDPLERKFRCAADTEPEALAMFAAAHPSIPLVNVRVYREVYIWRWNAWEMRGEWELRLRAV